MPQLLSTPRQRAVRAATRLKQLPGYQSPGPAVDDALGRLVDREERLYKRAFLEAVADLRAEVDLDALAQAIAQRNVPAIQQVLDAVDLAFFPLSNETVRAFGSAGTMAAREAEAGMKQLGVGFDLTDARALAAVSDVHSIWVREFTQQAKEALAAELAYQFAQGRSPIATARIIRDRLGLTPYHMGVVRNFEAALRQAVAGEVSFAALQSRYALSPLRGPGGLVASRVDDIVARYSQRMLATHAETVARTQTVHAVEAGRLESWRQMQGRGSLSKNQLRRWITAPTDYCQFCRALKNKTTKLTAPFPDGTLRPPRHWRCRCRTVLVFKSKRDLEAPPLDLETALSADDINERTTEALLRAGPADLVQDIVRSQGMNIRFTRSLDAAFRKRLLKELDSIPPEVRAALDRAGVSFRVGRRIDDLVQSTTELAATPQGWSVGTRANSAGFYRPATKEIFLVREQLLFNGKWKPVSNLGKVLRHETGHAVADALSLTNNPALRTAWDALVQQKIAPMLAKNMAYYIQGGSPSGFAEAIADGVAHLFGGGLSQANRFARLFGDEFLKLLQAEMQAAMSGVPFTPAVAATVAETVVRGAAEKAFKEALATTKHLGMTGDEMIAELKRMVARAGTHDPLGVSARGGAGTGHFSDLHRGLRVARTNYMSRRLISKRDQEKWIEMWDQWLRSSSSNGGAVLKRLVDLSRGTKTVFHGGYSSRHPAFIDHDKKLYAKFSQEAEAAGRKFGIAPEEMKKLLAEDVKFQDMLADALGLPKEVKLYRGVRREFFDQAGVDSSSLKVGQKLDVGISSLSSWSANKATASGFGQVVMEATVPRSQLIKSWLNGFDYGEAEFIVAGPKLRVKIIERRGFF